MDTATHTFTVLFSPLDWGLGHATRSIPLLKGFAEKGYSLFIACEKNGASEKILQREFPQAYFLSLKGYKIAYAKNPKLFALKIILQIPKILSAIKNERKQIEKWRRQYQFDLIISDNRYGFRNRDIKSVFMTHQLQIAAPFSWLGKLIQRFNYGYINRFSECWIPDFEGENNIAGKLSHPKILPKIPVKYIGLLSRLKKINAEKKYDFLLLLSGPEPQRTTLENNFLNLKNQFEGKVVLVRGLPKTAAQAVSTENFIIKNYCDAEELSLLAAQSEYVIARSGYSTVMDVISLRKKAIFIPTQGQTEQEYLAETLMNKGIAFAFPQSEKNYYAKLQEAKKFNYRVEDGLFST